jgi:PelA/Pel-15E family pectate lyase
MDVPQESGLPTINRPLQSVTLERIADLDPRARGAWSEYWHRSQKQQGADRSAFTEECAAHRIAAVEVPPLSRFAMSIPLDKPFSWYRSEDALRLGKNIVSFQTSSGGWSKNIDFANHARHPGEHFTASNPSPDAPTPSMAFEGDPLWHYVGTFDNHATTSQLRFLAKLIICFGNAAPIEFSDAFQKGLEYVLSAQFPGGGWPQVWPLEGGYHDCISFNDDAIANILNLLLDIAMRQFEFGFVQEPLRERCDGALSAGVRNVLGTQILDGGGHPTVWCQQYDPLTLEPSPGRQFEPVALCSAESAGLICFLIRLSKPSDAVVRAIRGAAEWFEKAAIFDREFKSTGDDGRHLVSNPGSGPIWSRFYDLSSGAPVFADRDGSVYQDLSLVSRERRDGYLWFSKAPRKALKEYNAWLQRWG